jgi:hypothetical protein
MRKAPSLLRRCAIVSLNGKRWELVGAGGVFAWLKD